MIHAPAGLQFREHALGMVFENSEVTVFFGDRNSNFEAVSRAFPDYSFSILNQTHSDLVVPSPFEGLAPSADAHFTRARRVALCVRTADCMPVMIHDTNSGLIAGIHAGWRGIENEIIRKTAARLAVEAGASLDRAQAWIGPHIGSESFEVGSEVATSLELRFDAVRGFSRASTSLMPHSSGKKAYVDLLIIARAQLASCGIERERVLEIPIDTVTSMSHESYRRDGAASARQISFIALK